MSFGKNLQFFRKMFNGMTQEDLAEKMQVSRQTISKWELDAAYPEIDKLIELCQLFSCTADDLIRHDKSVCNEAYSNIRFEYVEEFRYIRYAAISMEPEMDAIQHVKGWAAACGAPDPEIIGWDFPFVSQEQINVFRMHGYTAAWVLPPDMILPDKRAEVLVQARQKYASITIKEPFRTPFQLIPNAYTTLESYLQMTGVGRKNGEDVISCFEKQYQRDGADYMDVYLAVN